MDLKKVIYALTAVAILLAGALAYIWWDKTSLVNELNVENMVKGVYYERRI